MERFKVWQTDKKLGKKKCGGLRMTLGQSLAQEPQPVYYSLIRFSLG